MFVPKGLHLQSLMDCFVEHFGMNDNSKWGGFMSMELDMDQ